MFGPVLFHCPGTRRFVRDGVVVGKILPTAREYLFEFHEAGFDALCRINAGAFGGAVRLTFSPSHADRRGMKTTKHSSCFLCKAPNSKRRLIRCSSLRSALIESIQAEHHNPVPVDGFLCEVCLREERIRHSIRQLELERGELSEVEREVATRAAAHEHVVAELEESMWGGATRGQRAADRIARVGGSWAFVITFIVVLIAWMALNSALLHKDAFDPYPFILLNLVLSCVAALQAPIIIMSQNRSTNRDRAQADQDFRINLKAEMELVGLHEKIDHLLHFQWDRMVELQQTQLDILNDLSSQKG